MWSQPHSVTLPIWGPVLRGHRRFLPTYFAPNIEKLPYGAT